jgi:hypothetical protein
MPDSQTFLDHDVLSIMKVEEILLSFYCQRKVKKLNFDSFISRQKATDNIAKEFKKRAKGRKAVIAMGSKRNKKKEKLIEKRLNKLIQE